MEERRGARRDGQGTGKYNCETEHIKAKRITASKVCETRSESDQPRNVQD